MKKHLKTHWLRYVVGGSLAYAWSWLIFVKVAVISPSWIVGQSVALTAFLVIWFISYFVILRLARYVMTARVVRVADILKLVAIWAFFEYLVSWLVAVVWMGEGGSLDSVLPFGSLAPFIMYTPFGFLSRLVGYHGLSALVVVVLLVLLRRDLQKFRLPMLGMLVGGSVLMWGLYAAPDGHNLQATIVAEQLDEQYPVSSNGTDLVVLPEYGLDGYSSDTVTRRFVGDEHTAFIGSKQQSDGDDIRNILVFGTTNQGFLTEIDKSRLIPAGEHLPYTVDLVLRASPNGQELLDMFKRRRGVAKGSDSLTPIAMSNGELIGGAVCSSIISTKDYQQLTKQGATILANSASLDIFNGSSVFSLQHKGLARFMATANARPFLQSSKDGMAFAVDHNGSTLVQLSQPGAARVSVATNSKMTPYSVLGEWTAAIGGLIIVVTFAGYVAERYGWQRR